MRRSVIKHAAVLFWSLSSTTAFKILVCGNRRFKARDAYLKVGPRHQFAMRCRAVKFGYSPAELPVAPEVTPEVAPHFRFPEVIFHFREQNRKWPEVGIRNFGHCLQISSANLSA